MTKFPIVKTHIAQTPISGDAKTHSLNTTVPTVNNANPSTQ
jgi:hypothetical protein